MRFFVERVVRYSFHAIIGLSMVLVTTPDLSDALHSAAAVFLWPVIGLLAYFLHLFEDTGKLASLLRHGFPGKATPGVLGTGSAKRA